MKNNSRSLREGRHGNGSGIIVAAMMGIAGAAAFYVRDKKKKKKIADSLEDINPDDDLQFVDDVDASDNEEI